ncbi:MAG: protein up-regulated by thyroid hormone-PQQ-dependent glucose dehydrogenase [Planctomycetota bacterium]|nr:MAG: protein up-regulated by thyroid hormone-PQQ-dependent glucose dehydrogenase [Planctomycetota bacterium]
MLLSRNTLPMFSLALTLALATSPLAACTPDDWVAPDDATAAITVTRAFPVLDFRRPVFLTGAGDGTDRLFVLEQHGVIHVFPNRDDVTEDDVSVFLDISSRTDRTFNEEGLLGLTFPDDYAESGAFYVHYSSTERDRHGVVSRFFVDASDRNKADPDSEEVVLVQKQPYRNHNGGMIDFGPDGYLYIAFGDGGAANDPLEAGQDLSTWLGKILRVRVSPEIDGYEVPDDNPFVSEDGARGEIWAYGLRNVWRFAFDRANGDLWAGDVGQNKYEEIDVIVRGGNYGWNTFEAAHTFKGGVELREGATHIPPVAEYPRSEGISVTGGYVYRGPSHPSLQGTYFFADYAFGTLWTLRPDGEGGYVEENLGKTMKEISSFGEDDAGELYVVSFDDGIDRVGVGVETP